jgi:hypothetical protein
VPLILVAIAVVAVVVLGLVVIGRETGRLAARVHPAVFDLEEAVDFIADALPVELASRLTHDDVRWVLRADADLLERSTLEDPERARAVVDEHDAVARILARADDEGQVIEDTDVVAILDGRTTYLQAIGAVGPEASDADDPRR